MTHRRTTKQFDDRDPRVTRLLREEYRAPADPAYWGALEARILGYVTAAPAAAEWWDVFAGWTRAGVAAAALATLVALSALLHTRSAEARIAYEAVVENAPAVLPAPRLAHAASVSEREATFRYVVEP